MSSRVFSIAAILSSWVVPAFGQGVAPQCQVRFQSIAQSHPIDSMCGDKGDGKGAMATQNAVKNNFCALDPPITLKFVDFDSLRPASFGGLPMDRAPLRHVMDIGTSKGVGEGSLIRLAAFVAGAHISDIGSGESVNCHLAGAENNDVHVNLVENPGDDLCSSVTAEISPHFRPVQWAQLSQMVITRPVRISGQLFFDASHHPCDQGGRVSLPKRRSTWEIHPVYGIDVCNYDALSSCSADDEKAWEPLDQWQNAESSPSRLGITLSPSIVHPKENVKIQISLLNSTNEPASLKQDIEITLVIASVNAGYRDQRSLKMAAGQAWTTINLQLPNAEIYSITASTPQLRPSSVFLSVVRGDRASTYGPGGTLLNANFGLPVEQGPLTLVQDRQRQEVIILISPSREVMADGVDAALVSALSVGRAAEADIRISLHSSLGFFDCPSKDKPIPCPDYPLILPKGLTQVVAQLKSTQMGASSIDAVPGTPNVDLDYAPATVQFGPPITKIAAEASPPEITLVDRSQLILHLTDEQGRIYVPSHPKRISVSIARGDGHLDPDSNSITLTPPNHTAEMWFIPGFRIGDTELTASTDQLRSINLHVRVRAPLALLLIAAMGGLIGGAIFISVHRQARRSRIVIGAITGFIFYWAVVFGVITTKSSLLVVSPLSDFAISVIGGWMGTEVFSVILKQFGVDTQSNKPG